MPARYVRCIRGFSAALLRVDRHASPAATAVVRDAQAHGETRRGRLRKRPPDNQAGGTARGSGWLKLSAIAPSKQEHSHAPAEPGVVCVQSVLAASGQ